MSSSLQITAVRGHKMIYVNAGGWEAELPIESDRSVAERLMFIKRGPMMPAPSPELSAAMRAVANALLAENAG